VFEIVARKPTERGRIDGQSELRSVQWTHYSNAQLDDWLRGKREGWQQRRKEATATLACQSQMFIVNSNRDTRPLFTDGIHVHASSAIVAIVQNTHIHEGMMFSPAFAYFKHRNTLSV